MKPLFLIAFSVLVLTAKTGLSHSYFVSIATMEYNDSTQSIDVSLKMTAHDFESILETKFNQRIHIENIADTSEIGRYTQLYLSDNFVLTSENQAAVMIYVGKEVTLRDELFFYLSFISVKNPKTVHIKNTLLFSPFPQQQNIVHYQVGSIKKTVTLVASKPEEEIKFD